MDKTITTDLYLSGKTYSLENLQLTTNNYLYQSIMFHLEDVLQHLIQILQSMQQCRCECANDL